MSDLPALGKIVIAGGSGFLGLSLATHLSNRGAEVVILSRSPPKVLGAWRHVSWDARSPGDWRHELDGADGLVNLAGRSVDCIKSPALQDEILRSRTESTRVLGQAVRMIDSPPPVWVQMSTAHIYGDPPELICDEFSPHGYGLAPFVGQAWEEEFERGRLPAQRGVIVRTSFVMGRDRGGGGGALTILSKLARWGLAGHIGSGKQGISWIHEADLNAMFEQALRAPGLSGPYIASSPNPVSQAEFMRELRRAVRMPIGLPAVGWMVRIAAHYLLHSDPDLILHGRYVVSRRLREAGFEFQFPQLRDALHDLLTRRTSTGTSG